MATTLQDVTKAIAEKKTGWEAAETEVSRYVQAPVEEINLFGLNLSEEDARRLLAEAGTMEATAFHVTAPPPPGIDWRNHGCNYVTPVRHQLTCGSCVAFATCACLESRVAIAQERCNPELDLSEAHLFFCGCGTCCRTGWQFVPALNWAKNGIGLERAFPYQPRNLPCPTPQPPPAVDVPSWVAVTSMVARKQAIASNGPVIGGLKVYEDFYFYKSGVYRYTTGVFRGLHAICVVGYQDDTAHEGQGYWIIKNSWGTGWGENGFMKIAYGECEIDTTYPFYDPDVHASAPLVS